MIETYFSFKVAVDEWQDDTYGFFTPTGWCLIGVSYTGWGWYKDNVMGEWKKRSVKEYWHFGIVLFNIGAGIWYHEKEG